ncbi:MAG: V-type ATP synthase subunit F [Lachnospiraceae bacterium]|nr:V-type ATP synthase subunit F [Lachnospiraceae bacterium]
MYRIGVLGDLDSIYGFATLGLEVWPVANAEDGKRILKEMVGTGFGVIYITESLYAEMQEEVAKEKEHHLPAIIPIPGIRGNTGQGMKDVKRLVEQAVGSDIIFND